MGIIDWWQSLRGNDRGKSGSRRATRKRRRDALRRSGTAELLEERLYLSASSISPRLSSEHGEQSLDSLWYLPPDYSGPMPEENHVADDASQFAVSGLQWSQPGGLGSSVTITYSYSNLLNGGLSGGLSADQLRSAVQEALGLWSSVAPLTFVEVADSGPPVSDANYSSGNHPQIRIGYEYIDGASGPNVLAHGYFPMGTGLGGDVHLDSANNWKLGPGSGIDVIEVLTHELGHALGLDHEPMPEDGGDNAIMNPYYGGRFTGGLGHGFLLQDDIDGIQTIYGRGVGAVIPLKSPGSGGTPGDDFGNAASTSAALAIGTSIVGVLETSGDQDWFHFHATAGTTYVFQTVLGTLPDTMLLLIDRDGTTMLRSNDNGFGMGAASKLEWSAPADGDYFLCVKAPQGIQTGSYALSASVKNFPPILAGIGERTMLHNQDALTIELSAADANGDPLKYSAKVLAGSTPHASSVAVRLEGSTLTIDPPDGFFGRFRVEVTVSDGVSSDSEAFWVNMTNTPVSLAPLSDLAVSHAAEEIEIPLPVLDADGDPITYDFTLRGSDLAYQLDQTYGFYATTDLLLNNYNFDKRHAGEKYVHGSGGAWYLIFEDGSLFRWKKSLHKSIYVATLDPRCYDDPRLLWDAQLAVLYQQSGALRDDTLLIDFPFGSVDSVEVDLNVSDGLSDISRTFTVHVTNSPPVLEPIGGQTMSTDEDSLLIPLLATDADGDPVTYSIAQEAGNPAYQIDQQLGLHTTSELLANNYDFNTHHRREKYLLGNDERWFFIRPGGKLYQWGTKIRNSKLIATLGDEYYVDPSLLYNAQPRGTDIASASISGNLLSIDPITGCAGTFDVTVTVSDGVSTDSETFFVTVSPHLESAPLPDGGTRASENVLYLNFDGADLSRDALVALAGDDWRGALDTQFDPEGDGVRVGGFLLDWTDRKVFIDHVISMTREQLAAFGVSVVRQSGDAVADVGATTVFVGDPSIAGAYEQWIGLASDIDVGNNNTADLAFVVPCFVSDDFDENARALSNLILHEAGHTWGLQHVDSEGAPDLMALSHEEHGLNALARPDAGFLNQTFQAQGGGGIVGPQNSFAILAALFPQPSPAASPEKTARRAVFGEFVATGTGTELKTLA